MGGGAQRVSDALFGGGFVTGCDRGDGGGSKIVKNSVTNFIDCLLVHIVLNYNSIIKL